MVKKRSSRASQPVSRHGAGIQYLSPIKKRDTRKKRLVSRCGIDIQRALAEAQLERLLGREPEPNDPPHTQEDDTEMSTWVDEDTNGSEQPPSPPSPILSAIRIPKPAASRRIAATEKLADSWNSILPHLEVDFARYRESTHGQRPSVIPSSIQYNCTASCEASVKATVQCLYISHLEVVEVVTCHCASVPQLLVQHGVFPSSPTKPRSAVSIDLLEIYRALFERSCDAITALAAALRTIYKRRGFQVITRRNAKARATDVFRESLGNAVQWFSNLRGRIAARVARSLATTASILLGEATQAALSTTEVATSATAALEREATAADIGSSAASAQWGQSSTMEVASERLEMTTTDISFIPTSVQPGTPEAALSTTEAASNTTETALSTTEAATSTPEVALETTAADVGLLPASVQPRRPSTTEAVPETMASDISSSATSHDGLPRLTSGRADRILRERCPACFGLEEWGRPAAMGADVQIGADGCFSYRHLRSAGDGPIHYVPSYFLPKEEVADAARRVAEARAQGKRRRPKFTPVLPQATVDMCQESWDAANEKKRKADSKRYDASGIFVMTCRHSQVLFLCNIDTPGEQQHYIVALIEHVICLLPPQATVLEAYDIGCVTDHSLNLFPILREGVRERLTFAINAMHAFGHQWSCQINYSPKYVLGMGLTDLECVERFWSRIRKLIPATRSQWNSRRIWMIDQYVASVNEQNIEGLGEWIDRQDSKIIPAKWIAAKKTLKSCGIPEVELQEQWLEQKAAQTSIRSHAPARLRRDLDKVLTLQTQIDAVEKAILDVKQSIVTSGASPQSRDLLARLQTTHETLSSQAQHLYASLNIHEEFPQLHGLPLEFVRTLFIMRDLKINIRKRAIGSFYEWETLDRAVGGRRESLGTKLHQATRQAISKRQPALLRAISKFNDLCSTLVELRPEGCTIPIPAPLSTQLNGLRNDPTLHEDVWVAPTDGQIPRWLADDDVRDGIRSLHSANRCSEEALRVGRERGNMRVWLEEELAVVSRAIETCQDPVIGLPLRERRERMHELRVMWAPVLRESPRRPATVYPPTAGIIMPVAAGSGSVSATSAASVSAASDSATSVSAASVRRPTTASVTAASLRDDTDSVIAAPVRHITVDASALVLDSDDDMFDEMDEQGFTELDEDDEDVSDVELLQDVLGNLELDEESSVIGEESVKFNINWEPSSDLSADNTFLTIIGQRNEYLAESIDVGCRLPRVAVGLGRRPAIKMDATDIDRLRSPTSRLNGQLINGVAAALLGLFGHPTAPSANTAARCALLSTYDLHRIQFNTSDACVWQHLEPTAYWEKDLWLIPIHRRAQEHWVFVAVKVSQQRLFFFDSLGQRSGWSTDLRDVMILITRMTILAMRHGYRLEVSTQEEPWIARPLYHVGQPLQTNGYDCGLWVLCVIASVLRGHAVPAVVEGQMPFVRHLLRDHILSLPIT